MPARPGGPNDYVIMLCQPQMWPALVKMLGRPELADDPRFKRPTRAGRTATR